MNEGLFRSSAGFGVTGYSCQLYESPAPGALECRKIPQCLKRSCPVMQQLTGQPAMPHTSPSTQLFESVKPVSYFPVGHPRGIADAIFTGSTSA